MPSKRTTLLALAAVGAGIVVLPRLMPERQSAPVKWLLPTPSGVPSAAASPGDHQPDHADNCAHCAAAKSAVRTEASTRVPVSTPAAGVPLPAATFEAWPREKGSQVSLKLPGGGSARLTIRQFLNGPDGGWQLISGVLEEPSEGSFIFIRQPAGTPSGKYEGAIRLPEEAMNYALTEGPDGEPLLVEKPADQVSCLALPVAPEKLAVEPLVPMDHPTDGDIPDYQNGVISLSSLPGATGVVYLDFDGEKGPFQGWDSVKVDAAHSGANNEEILHVWARVAEDFAPFNVNVTTDLEVYLKANPTNRQRCIVTPTRDAAPTAGGVAYLNSWDWAGDVPCWAFYSTGKSSAEVISHEVGHTLGLSHDGQTPDVGYYGGHGGGDTGWAPIMGVGYYQNVTQWSKGEYPNANNKQDDLVEIVDSNEVALKADDHGNEAATASWLELYGTAVDDDGLISTRGDVDAFRFTTTGGKLELTISPVAEGPNLDLSATLRNSAGGVVVQASPAESLGATLSVTNLAAGTYTILIDGVGFGSPPGNGYTDYASLGFYQISGSVQGALPPRRFSVREFASLGTDVGQVLPYQNHGSSALSYQITGGNENGAFNIDAQGIITVARPSVLDYSALSRGWNDPAEMELFVTITDGTTPSLNETIRVVVTVLDANAKPPVSLAHRYSFNENAQDGIGAADLTLRGTARVSDGKLQLPGGAARSNYAAAMGASLSEVAATMTGHSAVTIEGWITQEAAQIWSKVFMAGSSNGADYFDFTPRRGGDGGVSSISLRTNGTTEVNVLTTGSILPSQTPYYFAAVWNESDNQLVLHMGPVGGTLSKYPIGSLGGRKLADVELNQFHLGAAVSFDDRDFVGSIDEFRIWKGALDDARVEANFTTGPNPPGDSDIDGLPDAWELSFAGVSSLADLDGNLAAGNGPGPGTGDFDGDGLSDAGEYNRGVLSSDPTVKDTDGDLFSDAIERLRGSDPTDPESVPTAVLAHRYGFEVDGADSVGSAKLDLVGAAKASNGALILPGSSFQQDYAAANGASLVELAETFHQAYAITLEFWVEKRFNRPWSKLFMTGRGYSGSYLAVTPMRGDGSSQSDFSIHTAGSELYAAGPKIRGLSDPEHELTYLACIWNPVLDQMTLHVAEVGQPLQTITRSLEGKLLSDVVMNEFYLGRSVQFTADRDFSGRLEEFRIWSGALDAAQVAASFAAGPGQPEGDVDQDGLPDPWEFSFAGVTHLDRLVPSLDDDRDGLNNLAEYQAGTHPLMADTDGDNFRDGFELQHGSDPKDPNSIPAIPAPRMKHRWAFSAGAIDSVGHADLSLHGNASVASGSLVLPGGAIHQHYASAEGDALREVSASIRNPFGVTVETWFTQTTPRAWSKVFMAGHGAGGGYMDLMPRRGNDGLGISMSFQDGVSERYVTTKYRDAALTTGNTYYTAAVWDPVTDALTLHIGIPGSTLTSVTTSLEGKSLEDIDINEFLLGAAVEFTDGDMTGKIAEFRVWNGTLDSGAVQASFQAGPAAPPGDADEDGLDDAWELSFAGINHLEQLSATGDFDLDGLNDLAELTAGTNPTLSDSDGDGFSDGVEAQAGSDPTDPDSVPALDALPVTVSLSWGESGLELTFDHLTPGQTYHLEEAENLSQWVPLAASEFTPAAPQHQVVIPISSQPQARRFYRLVVGTQP